MVLLRYWHLVSLTFKLSCLTLWYLVVSCLTLFNVLSARNVLHQRCNTHPTYTVYLLLAHSVYHHTMFSWWLSEHCTKAWLHRCLPQSKSQKWATDIKLLIHTIKPTNALMLKLYFYTQFVITATYFNLSWSSSGSYLPSKKHL